MFPSEDEKQRARRIEDNYALFRGNHMKVLRYFRTYNERRNMIEVIENLPGTISRVFADLMFLHPPVLMIDDKTALQNARDFWSRSSLHKQLHESALAQSYAGRAYFELHVRDGLAYAEELNPATVFPEYPALTFKGDPVAVRISWNPKIDGKDYQFVKTHTVGRIDYALYVLNKAGQPDGKADLSTLDASLPAYEETGLDFIPVYIIDNQKTGTDMCGLSDYDDIRSQLEELDRCLSQIATQLKKHATAKMAVPPGVLDNNGQFINENFEAFEVQPSEEGKGIIKPEFIANPNSLIEFAFKQAERTISSILRSAEVAEILVGLQASGGAEKVGALRLRMLRTLAKVQRKLWAYDVLKRMTADALVMQDMARIPEQNISIEFSNGLPEDQVEQAQVESTRMTAGLQTLEDAIKNLDGLQGELLTQKVQKINDERTARQGATPVGFGGSRPVINLNNA